MVGHGHREAFSFRGLLQVSSTPADSITWMSATFLLFPRRFNVIVAPHPSTRGVLRAS